MKVPKRLHLSHVLTGAGLLALVMAALPVQAEPAVKMSGGMLVDTAGKTLYTFDRDTAGSGKSSCTGQCAVIWPPAMAPADATPQGDLGIVTREDGSKQWSYRGKPLYTYKDDKKPGDKAGDNFKDIWHVIK